MEEAGGWMDGGTGTAQPGVWAWGKNEMGEKEQRESPRSPFPNYYRDPPNVPSSVPLSSCGRCGGEETSGLGIPELIPQSMARFVTLFWFAFVLMAPTVLFLVEHMVLFFFFFS